MTSRPPPRRRTRPSAVAARPPWRTPRAAAAGRRRWPGCRRPPAGPGAAPAACRAGRAGPGRRRGRPARRTGARRRWRRPAAAPAPPRSSQPVGISAELGRRARSFSSRRSSIRAASSADAAGRGLGVGADEAPRSPRRRAGAQCGSQRTQPQRSLAVARARRGPRWPGRAGCAGRRPGRPASGPGRCRGLAGPVRPATPSRRMASATGTAWQMGGSQRGRPGLRSRANSRSAGRSASPTRSRSASGSWIAALPQPPARAGRGEQHLGRVGRAAARGRPRRRPGPAPPSASKASIRSRYSLSAWRCCFLPCRRSLHHWPIMISGVISAISRKYHCLSDEAMVSTEHRRAGSAASSCSRIPSSRLGSVGTVRSAAAALARRSRGGRL